MALTFARAQKQFVKRLYDLQDHCHNVDMVTERKMSIHADAAYQTQSLRELGSLASLRYPPLDKVHQKQLRFFGMSGVDATSQVAVIALAEEISLTNDASDDEAEDDSDDETVAENLWSVSFGVYCRGKWKRVTYAVGTAVWVNDVLKVVCDQPGQPKLYFNLSKSKLHVKVVRQYEFEAHVKGKLPYQKFNLKLRSLVRRGGFSCASSKVSGWSQYVCQHLNRVPKLCINLQLVSGENVYVQVPVNGMLTERQLLTVGNDTYIRVLETQATVSDTSSNLMFFPVKLDLQLGHKVYHVEAVLPHGTLYSADGNMNGALLGHVTRNKKVIGYSYVEAWYFQSAHEKIETTLRLANFRNLKPDDWKVFNVV